MGVNGHIIDASDASDLIRVLTLIDNNPQPYLGSPLASAQFRKASEQCDAGSSTGGFVGGTCEFCTGDCACVHCDPATRHMGNVDFVLTASAGNCGDARDGSNTVIKNLTCGGLSIGAGASLIPEGPTPDGSQSRFALDCCGASSK